MAASLKPLGLAALLFLSLGGAAGAASPTTFADATGDAASGPDITQVTVSDASGRLTFAVETADAAAWAGSSVDILVDSDADYTTGHGDGVDHLFTLRADRTFSATRWDGASFVPYGSRATGTLTGSTLTVTAPLVELGNTRQLAFAVIAATNGVVGDQAPDGSFAPGTPPRWRFSPEAEPRVVSVAATFSPGRPTHGRRFAVAALRERLSTGSTRSINPEACIARLNGARLGGRCSWTIPKTARRKRLAVTVSAAGLVRRYAFVVR